MLAHALLERPSKDRKTIQPKHPRSYLKIKRSFRYRSFLFESNKQKTTYLKTGEFSSNWWKFKKEHEWKTEEKQEEKEKIIFILWIIVETKNRFFLIWAAMIKTTILKKEEAERSLNNWINHPFFIQAFLLSFFQSIASLIIKRKRSFCFWSNFFKRMTLTDRPKNHFNSREAVLYFEIRSV